MPALHLIQNQTDPKLLPRPERPGSDVWMSGYWSLAEATVESLVGGRVYFHKALAKPAFFGGELLGYRVADEAPYAGRIIFMTDDEGHAVVTLVKVGTHNRIYP